ncbi:MAG: glycosyltransferase [Pseudomonadota bacterium]
MIPRTAHFIWFGAAFPWVHVLAMRSAALRGGFERIVLHHSDDLVDTPWWREASATPGFSTRSIDEPALFRATGADGEALLAVYRDLEKPEARSNMLRAAILAAEGGVYLDMDTITVTSFTDLLDRGGAFYGLERIVFPGAVRQSRRPGVWAGALARAGFRAVCRRRRDGWRLFRRIEGRYSLAANNAVMGGEAGHPFLLDLLQRMIALPPERRRIRFSLGTHLLQDTADACTDPTVRALPPETFFPVGPEVSEHWFREDSTARAGDLVLPSTLAVHWYASVRTKAIVPYLTPDYVRGHRATQAFSELASEFLSING